MDPNKFVCHETNPFGEHETRAHGVNADLGALRLRKTLHKVYQSRLCDGIWHAAATRNNTLIDLSVQP